MDRESLLYRLFSKFVPFFQRHNSVNLCAPVFFLFWLFSTFVFMTTSKINAQQSPHIFCTRLLCVLLQSFLAQFMLFEPHHFVFLWMAIATPVCDHSKPYESALSYFLIAFVYRTFYTHLLILLAGFAATCSHFAALPISLLALACH